MIDLEETQIQVNLFAMTFQDKIIYLESDSRNDLSRAQVRAILCQIEPSAELFKKFKFYARKIKVEDVNTTTEMTQGQRDFSSTIACDLIYLQVYEEQHGD